MTEIEKYRAQAKRLRWQAVDCGSTRMMGAAAEFDAAADAITALCDRLEAAERETLERCAKACDDYAVDRQALFEVRPPYAANDEGCADPHTQGESDGAESCAEIIRKMITDG